MPLLGLPPRRARGPLGAALLALVAAAAAVVVARRHGGGQLVSEAPVCNPNLARLANEAGQEVLLIGALPLDLDGASSGLVKSSLKALRPDIVMVEGTWVLGAQTMLLGGRWEMHGVPALAGEGNWTDIGSAAPVQLARPKKKRGFLSFGSPAPGPWPSSSYVPLKVGKWAQHLHGSVGRATAEALSSAAADGVPAHFLGPKDGGGGAASSGHVQVALLAGQAARELMEEEQQRGSQLEGQDIDAALLRAEGHVREDSEKWLLDARKESRRRTELHRQKAPEDLHKEVLQKMEERLVNTAQSVAEAMDGHQRGAVVVSVEFLAGVEEKLLLRGYSYVSACA